MTSTLHRLHTCMHSMHPLLPHEQGTLTKYHSAVQQTRLGGWSPRVGGGGVGVHKERIHSYADPLVMPPGGGGGYGERGNVSTTEATFAIRMNEPQCHSSNSTFVTREGRFFLSTLPFTP